MARLDARWDNFNHRGQTWDHFWLDAQGLTTIESSFTADAVLLRVQAGSLTADAVVFKTSTLSFTADAVVFATSASSFTADAATLKTQTGSLTGDGVTRRGQTGSFAADAVISDGSSSFVPGMPRKQITAASRYRRQKRIAPQKKRLGIPESAPSLSFTANAVIAKLIWDDDFARTQDPGWGRQYVDRGGNTDAFASVDGSAGVVDAAQDFEPRGYAAVRISGIIQYDFWVPALGLGDDNFFYFAVDSADPVIGVTEPAELEIYANGGDEWAADIFPSDIFVPFTPDPAEWYRIKGAFDATSGGGGAAAIKVWKASDPEPATYDATGTVSNVTSEAFWTSAIWWDAFEFYDGKIDNLKIWTTNATWAFNGAFSADASIIGTVSGSFTANAVIDEGHFHADAILFKTILAVNAPIPPLFVSSSNAAIGTASTLTITKPSGVAEGDILIAFLSVDGVSGISPPSGWVFKAIGAPAGLDRAWVYEKTATSSEPANYTWALGASASRSGGIVAYRNVASVTYSSLTLDDSSNHVMTAPTIASHHHPAVSLVVAYWTWAFNNGGWSTPTGLTERFDTAVAAFAGVAAFTVSGSSFPTTAYTSTITSSDSTVSKGSIVVALESTGTAMYADAGIKRTQSGTLRADALINQGDQVDGSFTADAVVYATVSDSVATDTNFTASAVIYRPGLPNDQQSGGVAGSPGNDVSTGATIVITYDGADITSDVLLREAEFMSAVNGQTGSCKFVVRDDAHTFEFVAGREITLDINGKRLWGGYLMRAKKMFFFPVQDTTEDEEVVRGWAVEGVDYNVLFQKRIVFSAAHPTTKIAFSYPANTYDDTIIKDIFDHYLDLSGLGISRTGVKRVDIAILDIPGTHHRGTVSSAGYTWAQMMNNISRATGAVYYISPTKVFTYVDVDTEDSVWRLTDQPTGTWDIGYQNIEIPFNGTGLVNDMLVWGAALGSDRIVFDRVEDDDSIDEHLRWQKGLFSQSLWRQSNTHRVARSYVYGTPQSQRGGKDDQISFIGTVFDPVFIAGQKVRCVSAIFDYEDVLPIRRMVVTFPTKPTAPNTVSPRIDLVSSHEIDSPWSFFEWILPRFPPTPPPDVDPPVDPEPAGCIQLLEDEFSREVTGNWGLWPNLPSTQHDYPPDPSEGFVMTNTWVPGHNGQFGDDDDNGPWYYTDGEYAYADADLFDADRVNNSHSDPDMGVFFDPPPRWPGSVLITDFTFDPRFADPDNEVFYQFYLSSLWGVNSVGFDSWIAFVFYSNGGDFITYITYGWTDDLFHLDIFNPEDAVLGPVGDWVGQRQNIRIGLDDDGAHIKVWHFGDPEPAAWTITNAFLSGGIPGTMVEYHEGFNFWLRAFVFENLTIYSNPDPPYPTNSTGLVTVGNVTLTDSRCEVQCFRDTFHRNVTDGWGTSDSGHAWVFPDFIDTGPLGNPANYHVDGLSAVYNPETNQGTPASDGVIMVPGIIAGQSVFDALILFSIENTTIHGDYEAAPQFYISDRGLNDEHGVHFFLSNDENEYFLEALGVGTNEPGDVSFLPLVGYPTLWGTVLNLHMRVEGGRVQASLWRDGDPEPVNWMVESGASTHVFDGSMDTFYFFDPNVGQSIVFYDFYVECEPLPGDERPSGYTCESPTTEDRRHFQLRGALISGSSQVFVDGLRQTRGPDYTEDPAGGEIIFANTLSIPQADSVYVCYTANGVPT